MNDPKVLSLFEMLINKDVASLDPIFSPRQGSWVSYPLVENHLGVDPDYSQRLLEDLCRLGYLERQFHERILFCPACNSRQLQFTVVCPKCGSQHLVRIRLLRHRTCNWTAPAEDFNRSGTRICPKCRNELTLLGSDYDDLGRPYRCEDCRELTRTPIERWLCRSCSHTYEKGDVRELILYRYLLNPTEVSKLRQEQIPRARVKELLAREGYDVQEMVKISGRSGAEHTVDMLATKRTGPLEHRIVVGFVAGDNRVDSEEVIKLYAKAYDVNAQDIILIATPRLSEDAEQFAQHYHIRVYNSDTLDRLVADTERRV